MADRAEPPAPWPRKGTKDDEDDTETGNEYWDRTAGARIFVREWGGNRRDDRLFPLDGKNSILDRVGGAKRNKATCGGRRRGCGCRGGMGQDDPMSIGTSGMDRTGGPSEAVASGPKRRGFRLAAYAVCIGDGRVLLARHASGTWTLPGGRVEHAEDPFDTVIREVAEETGCTAEVESLLGVDSRVIPAAAARAGVEHQNVGIFYRVRITGGTLRPEPSGETVATVWTPIPDVAGLHRSSLVDIGLALARTAPPTGHVAPVPVGGLIQH
ncbi:ADP-ribose pyrophosphatase YjhB (NUDIX family) [Murinocardiopsis flavida]|uniref:ADP-ribose pyrophosphatase YjhB (NUDIX family) n=1 Tax=Murinocardiopsis flavida TaxID=645275 RepID=A0A2P8D8Y3_9ACTN|nr:NUDIX domain-containing protein [Murinocardiopsis flavida]PSK93696.1 ADP-ribose pyrophosphatase YjhB (NUDIX family) [Murinocardiopsis flavida]